MKLYLDSSAIVKLIQRESESDALRRYLRRHRDDIFVTSALARVEVVRAVQGGGRSAVQLARRQLNRLHQVALEPDLLDRAATLSPGALLRSLDAIHVASAQLVGSDLRMFVAYDVRLCAVATGLGLPVATPE